jgi:pterin-4a-carbinolamine dehydratase
MASEVPGKVGAREPALALDRAAITVFRDTLSLQAARQVKSVVRPQEQSGDMGKALFINYRRADSSAVARGLRDNLVEAFGDAVFMDVDEIRVGDTWPQALENALSDAAVLLVVIGPTWLRIADAYGRRRLDLSDDWVRAEIERSLVKGIPLIPVLVGRATMPPKEALPNAIAALVDQQYIELRETHWKQDLQPLIERLTAPPLMFERRGDRVPVPEWRSGSRPDHLPRPLTAEEVRKELEALPNWKIVSSPLPGEYPRTRTELIRRFKFKRFDRAIAFMQAAVPHIDKVNHHPRWENVFKTVSVWLSTWDSGHVITKLDFDLARYLDGLFEQLNAQKVEPAAAGRGSRDTGS